MTINEKEKAKNYFEKGVIAIYTDRLNPKIDAKYILRKMPRN